MHLIHVCYFKPQTTYSLRIPPFFPSHVFVLPRTPLPLCYFLIYSFLFGHHPIYRYTISLSIRLHLFVSLQIIANHHMQSISFASGGDPVSPTSFTFVFFSFPGPSFSRASYFSPSIPVLLWFELIPSRSCVVSVPLVMSRFSCNSKLTFLTFDFSDF